MPVDDSLNPLEELKLVARRIIAGESEELGASLKGEVGELLRLLVNIKNKVDDITPSMLMSHNEFPGISVTLNGVNRKTEEAAKHLLVNAQKLESFYKNLLGDVNGMAEAVTKGDGAGYAAIKRNISDKIEQAGDLGLYVLETLEFQDITEQELRRVIRSLDDVGARIGAIVGFIRAGDIQNRHQYDGVLSDLGFA